MKYFISDTIRASKMKTMLLAELDNNYFASLTQQEIETITNDSKSVLLEDDF